MAVETGMLQRRAAGLLPLLTFMRKAVGMSEGLLVHHVRYLGAMQLLFTAQQLEAIAQDGKPATRANSIQVWNSIKAAVSSHSSKRTPCVAFCQCL